MRMLIIGVVIVIEVMLTSRANADESPKPLSAKEILHRSDNIRNPSMPFATQITITEYNKAKEVDKMVIKVHSKQQKNSGQYRSLVEFLQPSRDSGKLMLKNGNEIWFYDPAASNSIRLSPQQRLMGQASNGDVMTANFALDYNVEIHAEEVIKDANKNPRITYRLHMTAMNENVTYAVADFWVEKQTNRPVKAKFYSSSNRLMKIAYYRRFQKKLGEFRPTEVLIIDAVDTNKVTRLLMDDFHAVNIPEAWFQRGYLPRFKG